MHDLRLLEATVNEKGGHLGFDSIIPSLGASNGRGLLPLSLNGPVGSSPLLLLLALSCVRQPEYWCRGTWPGV